MNLIQTKTAERTSHEESPRPSSNALLISWMEMEWNQKCLSLALETNKLSQMKHKQAFTSTSRRARKASQTHPCGLDLIVPLHPNTHLHYGKMDLWISHKKKMFRRRGFQMCWFHCFTRVRKASRSTRHFEKTWEIINTSLLLMERNTRLCSSAHIKWLLLILWIRVTLLWISDLCEDVFSASAEWRTHKQSCVYRRDLHAEMKLLL